MSFWVHNKAGSAQRFSERRSEAVGTIRGMLKIPIPKHFVLLKYLEKRNCISFHIVFFKTTKMNIGIEYNAIQFKRFAKIFSLCSPA